MWKGQAPSAKWSCCPIKHPPSEILPISHHSFLTPFPGGFLEKSIPFLPTVVIDLSFPRVSSALELLWLGPLLPRTLQLVTQTPALRRVLCVLLGVESWGFNVKMANLFSASTLGGSEPYPPQIGNRELAMSLPFLPVVPGALSIQKPLHPHSKLSPSPLDALEL